MYQYITKYNKDELAKKERILPKKSYNWEGVAKETLGVFEKVFKKTS